MRLGDKETDDAVYVIAEIGNNHEGALDVAQDMIVAAAACGVDAVKFQTFKTERYVSQDNAERFQRLKRFELTYSDFEKLSRLAASEGVDFISTPFDLESAQFLGGFVTAMKIASSDNVFFPLIEKVAGFDLPLLLSGGFLDVDGLRASLGVIEEVRRRRGSRAEACLMHCVCSYPVAPESANLRAVETLRREFPNVIGYSDHTLDGQAVLAAVALGARVIEKHFTLDKGFSEFRDHQISADPPQMAQIVSDIRLVDRMLGDGVKRAQPSEMELEPLVRRSIRASRALEKGETVTLEDIKWVRPSGGLEPGQENLVLGGVLRRSVKADELLLVADLES